jgi:predicted TPR repeat methyltransferase
LWHRCVVGSPVLWVFIELLYIGLVSRALSAYCKRNVGVDISQGMVDQFNKRIDYQGLTSDEMQAVCAELKGQAGELGDEKFDAVVVSTIILRTNA